MNKQTLAFIVSLLLITSFCNAQKSTAYNNQQWLQYYNQLKLSGKLTIYSDFSLRKINNFEDWSQITFRTGLGYRITQNLQGITGFAFFTFYTQNKLSKIEFRPYQEVNTLQLFGKVSVQHRFRIEARYFIKIYEGATTSITNFNFRFRYRLFCAVPISKLSATKPERKLLLNIGDEIFINAGKEITYNMFDNNRFLIGLTLQYNNNFSFSFAYINQYGQRNKPAAYEHSDILTLGITHKISVSKH